MDHRAELVDVIRRIRNRWRLRLALRGAVVVVAGMVLVLLLSASGLEALRFSAPAIIGFRFLAVAVFAALLRLRAVAAAAAGDRHAGRAVPRRARPVARSRDSERGRSHGDGEATPVAAAGRAAGRAGHRAEPGGRATAWRSSARGCAGTR